MRGQANLPALAVALLVVTTTASLGVVVADGAFAGAERDAIDRAGAAALADRLVGSDSPLTERRNVLNASRLEADGADGAGELEASLEALVPDSAAVRVAVDGEVVFERGDPTGGPTVRRLVLLAEGQEVTFEPPLAFGETTLPRRSAEATITIAEDADVETVRANDRVILHDPGGLDGSHDVALSRYETTRLRFDGDPQEGDVTVTFYPERTRKATLEVTVDAGP